MREKFIVLLVEAESRVFCGFDDTNLPIWLSVAEWNTNRRNQYTTRLDAAFDAFKLRARGYYVMVKPVRDLP